MSAVKCYLLAVAMCVCAGHAWPQAQTLEPIWQRNHAAEATSLDTRASAATADGGVAVLGVQRPLAQGKDKSADKAWIGIFAADGQLRRQVSFVMRLGESAIKDVDAFLPLQAGGFVVAGQSLSGETWLVHVDTEGFARPLRSLGRSRVAMMVALADGGFVLGGRTGRDLFAARLRADAASVWERELDRGFDDVFLAGVLAADGVVALEHSGVREQFFMRDAVVGITTLGDAESSLKAPRFTVQGRAGALAAASDGYGLLVDTGAGVKQSLRFIRLDRDFKPRAQADVLAVDFSLERARLANAGSSGFVLVALDGSKLVGLQLDAGGQVRARFDTSAGRVFMHPDVVISGGSIFVVASELMPRDDKRGARSTAYVAKLPVVGN